ncbi:MAG: isocitrate lyase/PEP mutase family protein [Gemmataceae bacterium]
MAARRLRELLERPGIIRTLGVHDAFSARLAEAGGLEMLFLGGFGVSASMLGLPDIGLLTLTEMADAVRRLVLAVGIPVVADGDTGHGDLHNVVRTVREFERAGAAGMLLEDQVFPKRCGHFSGKQLISPDEMVLKLRAALQARSDPNFVILARTDARAVEGIDAAIDRLRRYAEVGADMGFLEAPTTLEELQRVPREVPIPLLVNMLTGGATPILGAQELEQMGYKIVVCPIESLLITAHAVRRLVQCLMEQGRVDGLEGMISFGEVKSLLRLDDHLGWRQRLPS